MKRGPYESEINEEVAREYMREQEERKRSPEDQAKEVEQLGSRMENMERIVASLDNKIDDSHRRLESMLKLLLEKGVPTAHQDKAPTVAVEEDTIDVHAPHEATTITTVPQTMPSPTHDTTEVADEDDAVDAGNEIDLEEVREEEVIHAGASEEELEGAPSEEVLAGGVSEELLGGAGLAKGPESPATQRAADESLAPEKSMEVAVQKVPATTNKEKKGTPKVVDSEKPEKVNCANM